MEEHLKNSSEDFVDGVRGEAVYIEGKPSMYHTLAYSVRDKFYPNIGTIEFWFRPEWGLDNEGTHYLFHHKMYGQSWDFNSFYLYKYEFRDTLIFALYDLTSTPHMVYGNISNWEANEWHHVAVTWTLTVAND